MCIEAHCNLCGLLGWCDTFFFIFFTVKPQRCAEQCGNYFVNFLHKPQRYAQKVTIACVGARNSAVIISSTSLKIQKVYIDSHYSISWSSVLSSSNKVEYIIVISIYFPFPHTQKIKCIYRWLSCGGSHKKACSLYLSESNSLKYVTVSYCIFLFSSL